jgi:hypothetical protein
MGAIRWDRSAPNGASPPAEPWEQAVPARGSKSCLLFAVDSLRVDNSHLLPSTAGRGLKLKLLLATYFDSYTSFYSAPLQMDNYYPICSVIGLPLEFEITNHRLRKDYESIKTKKYLTNTTCQVVCGTFI